MLYTKSATSGQIPIDPATGAFVEGGIKEQTRQSLTNVRAILEEAGLTMSNVVKTTVFLADMNDFADMNAVYAEFFSEPYPARSAVAVKTLPKGALVEIEVVAEVACCACFMIWKIRNLGQSPSLVAKATLSMMFIPLSF